MRDRMRGTMRRVSELQLGDTFRDRRGGPYYVRGLEISLTHLSGGGRVYLEVVVNDAAEPYGDVLTRDGNELVVLLRRPWSEGVTEQDMLKPILERLGIQGPWESPERSRYQMLDGSRGDITHLREWLRELRDRVDEYLIGFPTERAEREDEAPKMAEEFINTGKYWEKHYADGLREPEDEP